MSRIWAVSFIVCAIAMSFAGAAVAQEKPAKFQCRLRDAQILPDLTQLRCINAGATGISEFAADTSQPYANRVAVTAVQAMRASGILIVTYAPGFELNPRGCDARTCRKIIDVDLVALQADAPKGLTRIQPQEDPFTDDGVDPFGPEETPSPSAPPARPAAVAAPAPRVAAQPFQMRPITN